MIGEKSRHAFDLSVDRNSSARFALALHFHFMIFEVIIYFGQIKKEMIWWVCADISFSYSCFYFEKLL